MWEAEHTEIQMNKNVPKLFTFASLVPSPIYT